MIYLDSAATSLQKPHSVPRAVSCAMTHLASPGRGSYTAAEQSAELLYSTREECGLLFGESNPENIVFTSSATHGLNIAIKSLVKPGATVLISPWEHNAVTRPLHSIPQVNIQVAQSPLFQPEATLRAFARCLTPQVDVVIFTHVSNVFGYILPIEEIAILCRQRGVPFIIDASQSAGSLPLSQEELQANFIAMPGHKGLLGPQGTGLLLCRSKHITPLLDGGTGSASRRKTMPQDLPDRLEAGTANVCGIAGLRAGIRYVRQQGVVSIQSHEMKLISYLAQGMSSLATTFLAEDSTVQSGVLSFQVEGWDCEELAAALGRRGFALRAGLHCAPLAHKSAGTLEEGTVRASVSPFTTKVELDKFLCTLSQLAKQGAF